MKTNTYVALLRGINVGGNNKVDMKQLKAAFGQVGMQSVQTYINSGNVVFESTEHSKATLVKILEQAIFKTFGLKIKVLLRGFEEIKAVCQAIPNDLKNDAETKADVLFLWEEVNHPKILEEIELNPKVDTVRYIPGALLWVVPKKGLSKSRLSKLVGTKLYKQMTVRNVNTVRKILGMMEG